MVSSVSANCRESEAISIDIRGAPLISMLLASTWLRRKVFNIGTIPEVKHWLPGPSQLSYNYQLLHALILDHFTL